jgi:signal transduction histidine kinase/ActR/RegA family two-component response regulator
MEAVVESMEAVVERLGSFVRRAAGLVGEPDERLAWTALPLHAQLYIAIVMLGGAATTAAFFPRTYPRPLLLLVLVITVCLTSLWKVNLPITRTSGATLSVSYAANLMALLLLGTEQALLVGLAGVWTQCTYKVKQPYPLYRTAFSLAAEALTMAATGVVYQQLGGPIMPVVTDGLARPLVAAIGTYFVVNTSLIAGVIGLTTGRPVLRAWREDFLWSGASFMVAGGAGAMAAVVVARGEHWKAVLLIAPVYLTYRTYELFVGRLDDQSRHVSEIRRLHQGTVEALMQAREAERAEQAARVTAERANRLKDEFLAIVSHELRTPLNSILGWADMLRRGRLEEPQRTRAFQAIYDGARRQAQLIDDLLDVSRIMSGKLRLELTAIELRLIVHDTVQAMQPVAEAKSVRVICEADDPLGLIEGDSARLQQVVSNLLSNALKFTPAGGRVTVELRRQAERITLTVTDTGQGISEEFLPWVFEPFRQADASSTRVHGGLGLGLSIVKHLVEAHHGTIRAESAGPGRGARFTASFPLAPAYLEAPGARLATRQERGGLEPPSLAGVSVLVVDDDPESRQVIAECLRVQQAMVHCAASASDAYGVLQRERVDVMLADIAMPGEDGYAFIRRVRAGVVPGCAALPAAALTAFAREEDRQLAMHAGFQMHLAKPVGPRTVVSAVANLAGLKAAGMQ